MIDTEKWGKGVITKEFPFNQIKTLFPKFVPAHCKHCE